MKSSIPVLALSIGTLGYAVIVKPPVPSGAVEISYGRDIRPILSENCFKCHGPDVSKAAGGLRLDSFAGATKELGGGAAVVLGHPEKSLLLQRVAEHDEDMRMPPPGPGARALSAKQIETLRSWILAGAKYERHWSFVPPKVGAVPPVHNAKWCRNLVDRYVLAKLERANLSPESEADRDTLALRAAQTLTGLPPSASELAAFRRDNQPGAYERYVDRLLAKPAYGEHQARYWLDAVRYGDTHGLQLDNERGVFPYRDWVIRAYNQDLPFNDFVKWQLAGDLLPKPTTEQMIATGYVRMNLTSNEGGAIEEEFLARNTFDRVDTTSTVFLGLTVGCAQCHDHKFDPIRQRDYYGLYAFFNSTEDKPLDGNILLPPPVIRAATPEQEARLARISAELGKLRDGVRPEEAVDWFTERAKAGIQARDWQISPVFSGATFDEAFDSAQPKDLAWKPFAFELGKVAANVVGRDNAAVFLRSTWTVGTTGLFPFRASADDGLQVFVNGAQVVSKKVAGGLGVTETLEANFQAGDNEVVIKVVNGIATDGLKIDVGDDRVEKALAEYKKDPQARSICGLYLENGPTTPASNKYRELLRNSVELEKEIPMTLVAREMATPRPTFILRRGQYTQRGDPVTRHIPPALGALAPGAPRNRLGLAQWMTSPANPLVARVFVNRIWQQHFGTGIVKTAEDFGSQGEWPHNQPLLDYLAVSFVKNGWSVKKLNRLIVTSAAFRQSSRVTKAKLAADPENRLISRGPRYRLDAEVIRDKALAAGGLLLDAQGGRGFKPYQPDGMWEGSSDPASETHFYVRDHGSVIYRRSLYQFWKRTSPPPVMLTFDAPSRDACTVRRSQTNTPLQALTTLNEPAFLEASRTMAARVLEASGDDTTRLRLAYSLTLGREPDLMEQRMLLRSLGRYRVAYGKNPSAAKRLLSVGDFPQSTTLSASDQAAWMIVCSSLMNTNEFLTQH